MYMNDIYVVYIWYIHGIHGILHVYAILIDMSGIYLVKISWVCSVPFLIMIYLGYTMNILGIFREGRRPSLRIPDGRLTRSLTRSLRGQAGLKSHHTSTGYDISTQSCCLPVVA